MTKCFYIITCMDYDRQKNEYKDKCTIYFLDLNKARKYRDILENHGGIVLIREQPLADEYIE